MRCGVTDVFDGVCDVCILSGWVVGGLFIGMVGAMREWRRVWRGRGKYVHKFAAGDGKTRRNVKWLTCLVLFVM